MSRLRDIISTGSALLIAGALVVLPAVGGLPLGAALAASVADPLDDATSPASNSSPAARTAVGADGRIRIAVVVPITVPATRAGILDFAALAAYTSPDGTLTRQLSAVIGRDVTLAIDPRIIASIRVLGSAAPASATNWLETLAGADNEIFALGYADADPIVAAQSGAPATALSPLGFGYAIDPANFAPVDDDDSELPPLPTTLDELLDWNYSLPSIAWPRDSTLSASDLPSLSAQGFGSVLINSTNVGSSAPRVAVTDDDSAPQLLVADDAVNIPLRQALASADDASAFVALDAVRAAVSAAAATPDGSLRIVTLTRDGKTSDTRVSQAINSLALNPGVELVGLSDALTETPVRGAIVDSPEQPERLAAISQMFAAEGADATFATVAVDPLLITGQRRADLLALLSIGWGTGAIWNAAVTDYLTDSAKLRNSVTLVESGDLIAIEQQTRLLVTVKNELGVPITVYATATPLQPILGFEPGDQPVEIPVKADSTATGYIPTQAIANGTVMVTLSLASSAGVPIGNPVSVKVNVQAGWVTAGAFVIGALVLAVFGVGLTRAILRRRRAAETDGDGDADGEAPDAPGTDGEPAEPDPEPAER